MKKITRRLLAFVLCAALALSAPCVFAQGGEGQMAQVVITLADGTQQALPVQMIPGTAGDTVYWLDTSMVTPEQADALVAGYLIVTDEAGDVLINLPMAESGIEPGYEGFVEVYDPETELSSFMLVVPMTMPEDMEETYVILDDYGYIGEELYAEFDIEEVEEDTEEYEVYEDAEIAADEEGGEIYIEEGYVEDETYIEEITEEDTGDEGWEVVGEVAPPQYVAAYQDGVMLLGEMGAENDVLAYVGAADILTVYDYATDDAGAIWWLAQDYRTGHEGYIASSDVFEIEEEQAEAGFARIDMEIEAQLAAEAAAAEEAARLEEELLAAEAAAEEAARLEAERLADEESARLAAEREAEAARLEAERLAAEQAAAEEAARIEAERLAAEQAAAEAERLAAEQAAAEAERLAAEQAAAEAERLAAEQAAADAERLAAEQAAADAERLAAEQAAAEAERLAAEQAAAEQETAEQETAEQETAEQVLTVRYAVTNNKNSNSNNMRAEPKAKAKVVGEYPNGVLLIIGDAINDGQWYPVTVVHDGAQGYMRDFLLTEIPEADAQERLADILADKAAQGQLVDLVITDNEEGAATVEFLPAEDGGSEQAVQGVGDLAGMNVVEAVIQPEVEPKEAAPIPMKEMQEGPVDLGQIIGGMTDFADPVIEAGDAGDAYVEPGDGLIKEFPAYAMTLEQENGAVIVLRMAPAGDLPQDGAIPMIREPSPLEVLEAAKDKTGETWYLVRNMSTNETGYIEAYKVEQVSREEAEANIKTPVSVIPPVPEVTEPEETEPETDPETEDQPQEGGEGEEEAPYIEPDVPQELLDGDVYHYGRNTGAQVALRKAPNANAGLHYRMEKGTILWVMQKDGEWCYVRTDKGEGYVMAKFVELMMENEEAAYRASLDDPEVAPEATEAPTQPEEPVLPDDPELPDNPVLPDETDPEEELPELIVPIIPEPTEAPTPEPTEAPTPEVTEAPTAEPTPEPTEEPTPTPEVTEAPTEEPTATPKATETPEPQRLELYARVINDTTPLRGNPNPNAYLQNILAAEDVVYVFQSQIAEDGMTWYLVQFNGQWGYVRADLVRIMGTQETADYLAMLEASMATPTPMPQATPEPVGPESTSAYAKLIKDSVNLRRTPSSSGTSLGRIPKNTLLLVTGEEYDGTYTWYQVNYNGKDGYIRSDMAKMLTIAELQEYLMEQREQQQSSASGTTPTVTPNKENNVNVTINGSQLQDLIPVDGSWTNNVIEGMPGYATATPDPNATPTPPPPAKAAALIGANGNLTVSNVPAVTENGAFSVYGKTAAYSTVIATVEMPAAAPQAVSLIPAAIAEQMVKKTVGQAVANVNGLFAMDVTLPEPGEYIVEFTAGDGSYARYGVTYDTGVTPEPTVAPLPTAVPVEEESGMGILPFVIGGVLVVVIAAAYGLYVYRRKAEEEEADEEDEDEEDELRQEQFARQRQQRAENMNAAQRAPRTAPSQTPSYMRNPQEQSPYARPQASKAPAAPQAPVMPKAPVAPQAPVMPKAPVAPQAPSAPETPAETEGAPRRRRRPPVDPNA